MSAPTAARQQLHTRLDEILDAPLPGGAAGYEASAEANAAAGELGLTGFQASWAGPPPFQCITRA